jgi:ferritin-like metal-binding protein YciE
VADLAAREAKLVQYLNEAFGKEKELETSLQAHIGMTTRSSYKKRLQQHLQETKGHARDLERRIRQLGGEAEAVSLPGPGVVSEAADRLQGAAKRGVALAKGPLEAVRGTSEAEKLLKNAKTEYWNEAEEIANYTAIQSLAETVGDRETASIARAIRRQEERMASFLQRLIPQLTRAVAQAEIPASQRNGAGRRRTTSRRTTRRTTTSTRSKATGRRTAGTGTSRRPTTRAASSRRVSSGRRTSSRSATTSRRASTRRTSSARSSGARRPRSRQRAPVTA